MGVPQQVTLPGGDSGTQAPSFLCLCHTYGGDLKLPCRSSPFECVCESACVTERVYEKQRRVDDARVNRARSLDLEVCNR